MKITTNRLYPCQIGVFRMNFYLFHDFLLEKNCLPIDGNFILVFSFPFFGVTLISDLDELQVIRTTTASTLSRTMTNLNMDYELLLRNFGPPPTKEDQIRWQNQVEKILLVVVVAKTKKNY